MEITREEASKQINAILEQYKGKERERWHSGIVYDLSRYMRQNWGENWNATDGNNKTDIYITFRGFTIFRIVTKCKKFTEYRAYYQAQFYYNAFDIINVNYYWREPTEKPEELAETLRLINEHIENDIKRREQQTERAKAILMDIMQKYQVNESEARILATGAAHTYLSI